MNIELFNQIGCELFQRGLNNSHSGNISFRELDRIWITRTGKQCHHLTVEDIIDVRIDPDPERDKLASMELLVHRAIYQADPRVGAVVHAHCPYAVVMTEDCDQLVPGDQEAGYYFKQLPVLRVRNAIASSEVANGIKPLVPGGQAAIIAGHGVFTWGPDLDTAYKYITVIESSCKLLWLKEMRHAAP